MRQGAGGRQSGQVEAKPHDQREQGAPVKTKGTHRAVCHEGCPRQIPRVLQDAQGRKHDGHDRKECRHRADPHEQAVDQQPLQPAVSKAELPQRPGDSRCQRPVDHLADGALQWRCERGRELEQQPHHRQEGGYPGPRVKQDGVQPVGERPAPTPSRAGQALAGCR